jgi:hypothetical protein
MFSYNRLFQHMPRCSKKKPTRRFIKPLDILPNNAEIYERVMSTPERRSNKLRQARWNYGIDEETYERMEREQNGLCAICGRPPTGTNRRTNSLHVDHDHATKQTRSLLCHQCNLGLGAFRDDPGLLLAAIDYLARHKKLGLVS